MTGRSDILILTSSYGGGHLQASRALAEGVQALAPGTRYAIANFMAEVSPLANRVAEVSYRRAVLHAPFLWQQFYRITSRYGNPDFGWQQRLNRLLLFRARSLLALYQPRVVVSTFPLPAGVMGELKLRYLTGLPLVTVITDQAVHSQWLHPATDLYLVGSDYVRCQLALRGVGPERIAVTGIPIAPAFATRRDRLATRLELGLEPGGPVILVMTGAEGMLPDAPELCQRLALAPGPRQVVVITGRNAALRKRVAAAVAASPWPVRVLGFVDNVEAWMATADVLVGKAGGLTTSEALARELPMIIIRPIPGQEEANTSFLTRAGAARRAPDVAAAVTMVEQILHDPALAASMRRAAARIARPRAALEAAAEVLALGRGSYATTRTAN
ncbi:MAG: processive 1,2-diacylglycerol beta-glucosyltransferase [Clostridia bacterium]|nr:processive 1,2-diacylglycerol beta-glucosyltransferase [Clostridia bacterium]